MARSEKGVDSNDRWFEEQLARKVGNGRDILFWTDLWLGDWNLCDKFPRLFSVSTQQGCWVCGSMEIGTGDFNLRRELRDFEADMLHQLPSSLRLVVPSINTSDRWVWQSEPEGVYSVKSAYDYLLARSAGPTDYTFLNLWSLRAPSNMVVFAWKVLLDRKKQLIIFSSLVPQLGVCGWRAISGWDFPRCCHSGGKITLSSTLYIVMDCDNMVYMEPYIRMYL